MDRSRLVEIEQQAREFLQEIRPNLNQREYGYILETINSKAIPAPKLLIKDHKKMKNGHLPTRLIVPATNFIAAFPKTGYLGIKKIFHQAGINYNKLSSKPAI